MKNIKVLVACYRSLPYYSASSDIVNRLLLSLDPSEYYLVSQDYRSGAKMVDDDAVSYEALGVVRFSGGVYRRIRPLINLLVIPWMVLKLLRLIRRKNCKQVLAVYPDFRFVMAAAFAAKLSKLPFYVWTHNSMESMQWPWLFNRIFRAESFIFNTADCIFAMSEGMKRYYDLRFPAARIVTLQHPISVEERSVALAVNYSERPIRLLFSGGINAGNWDALRRLLEAFGNEEMYEIHVCTRLERGDFTRRFGEWSNIIFHGFVTTGELERLVALSHVLLLPHGLSGPYPEVEYVTMFPTKTVSYLNSGKPIFAHVTPGSAIDVFLRSKRAAVVVSEVSVERLRVAMMGLVESEESRSKICSNAKRALAYFDVSLVVDILRKELSA